MHSVSQLAAHGAAPRPTSPTGYQLSLHPEGGLLTKGRELDLSAGDGIAVELRLSTGIPMQFTATVRWVREREGQAELAPGAWIDFTDLGVAERREFQRWLRYFRASRGSSTVEVTLARKYRVRHRGPELSVWLGGRLESGESEALRGQVELALDSMRGETLALLIDASEFRPSPEDSLTQLRAWLEEVAAQFTVLGVLVGTRSVGNMQFARLAREAELADSLVSLASLEQARQPWAMILDQVYAVEQVAGRSGSFERNA